MNSLKKILEKTDKQLRISVMDKGIDVSSERYVGNAEFAKEMDLLADYSGNFMGNRCKRFALIAENNSIITFNIEEKGQFLVSSAEYILDQL